MKAFGKRPLQQNPWNKAWVAWIFCSECLMDPCARKLTELVERHYAQLFRYAYRLSGSNADAEDLTQNAFLTAQAKWEQLREEASARSWLFTIVRNAYLKQLRSPTFVSAGELDALPANDVLPDKFEDFDGEQLQNVLNDLSEEFRSPLILYYFDDFSYKEIAEHMGVPIGTVMSRLARAKAYLRSRLSTHEMSSASETDLDTRPS
jgi:RNA polymerase sigma-70 factor (ECF subfamily)